MESQTGKSGPPRSAGELNSKPLTHKAIEPWPVKSAEIHRIWLPASAGCEPSLRTTPDGSAFIVEVPLHHASLISDPPHILQERVDAAALEGVKAAERADIGHYPRHLDLVQRPKLDPRRDPPLDKKKAGRRPLGVFPPDTRSTFRDAAYPWSTVGRVESAWGIGTGTMVGRRLMLTASHCIGWQAFDAGWLKFTPAYYDGAAPFGSAWAERVLYWRRVNGSAAISTWESAFDYVVVVLDRDLGEAAGWTGYREYDDEWNGGTYWQTIGYPHDLAGFQRPSFGDGGRIMGAESIGLVDQEALVLGHFMDMSSGHSGGPIWGWWDGEEFPRVVGVQSTSSFSPADHEPEYTYIAYDGDNQAGGGEALYDLIRYAREHYA
jgi:V8-like Glu-specific endopeptidase